MYFVRGKTVSMDALLPGKSNTSSTTFFIFPCGTIFWLKRTHASGHLLEAGLELDHSLSASIDNRVKK
jgi:hypothetical protein